MHAQVNRDHAEAEPELERKGQVPEAEMTDDRELFALLYTELKRRAWGQLRRLPPGQTLQPTALVHEAYARLQQKPASWKSRSQFFAVAVTAMRTS